MEMKTFENDKILVLTKDGFLSCFSIYKSSIPTISGGRAREEQSDELLSVKRLNLEEGEVIGSLAVDSVLNTIIVVSVTNKTAKRGILLDKCINRDNRDFSIRDVAKITIYGFSFDFEDNYFAKKFQKNFEIEIKNGKKLEVISSEIIKGNRACPILYMMVDDGGARAITLELFKIKT